MNATDIVWLVLFIIILIFLFIGLFRLITVNEVPDRSIDIMEEDLEVNPNELNTPISTILKSPPSESSFVISRFQTGDLIFFTHSALGDALLRLFTASPWLHAGIIVRDRDNTLYVMEMGTHDTREGRFMFIKLKDWLKKYRRQNIGYVQYQGPEISLETIVSVYHEFKNVKLNRFGLSWLRFATKKQYIPPDLSSRSYTCCEIVIMVLQRLNIMKKEYTCCSYYPGDIARLDFSTESGTRFLPMIKLRMKSNHGK